MRAMHAQLQTVIKKVMLSVDMDSMLKDDLDQAIQLEKGMFYPIHGGYTD